MPPRWAPTRNPVSRCLRLRASIGAAFRPADAQAAHATRQAMTRQTSAPRTGGPAGRDLLDRLRKTYAMQFALQRLDTLSRPPTVRGSKREGSFASFRKVPNQGFQVLVLP